MNNFTKVKHLGRTWLHDGILWLPLSASGIAFSFTGKKLSVTIAGDDSTKLPFYKQKEPARVAIYIDGQRKKDRMIKAEETILPILSSRKATTHEIMILKLTEAPMSIVGIKEFTMDDAAEITPLPAKKRKIEFIGDSITCGYGVDDEVPEHHYKTSTQDATKAFAYRCAEILDADYSLVSFSGHGIISGYVENGVPKLQELVPPLYTRLGLSRGLANGRQIYDEKWDFTKFIPDTIVINLGTNDDSYCQDHEERQNHFASEYAQFLRLVRMKNPSAKIVLILGVMGDRLFPFVQKAMEKFIEMTGDDNIEAHRIEPIKRYEGYVADYHPTSMTHERVAKQVAAILKGEKPMETPAEDPAKEVKKELESSEK